MGLSSKSKLIKIKGKMHKIMGRISEVAKVEECHERPKEGQKQ